MNIGTFLVRNLTRAAKSFDAEPDCIHPGSPILEIRILEDSILLNMQMYVVQLAWINMGFVMYDGRGKIFAPFSFHTR